MVSSPTHGVTDRLRNMFRNLHLGSRPTPSEKRESGTLNADWKQLASTCKTKLYDGHVVQETGAFHGLGIMVTSKSIYAGEWREGKRHGVGVLVDLESRTMFEGCFRDDLPNGAGRKVLLGAYDSETVSIYGKFENGELVKTKMRLKRRLTALGSTGSNGSNGEGGTRGLVNSSAAAAAERAREAADRASAKAAPATRNMLLRYRWTRFATGSFRRREEKLRENGEAGRTVYAHSPSLHGAIVNSNLEFTPAAQKLAGRFCEQRMHLHPLNSMHPFQSRSEPILDME
eukprot:comp6947_c0_seq1/m.2694 comp6947_c0_seq1/g.2694  ORF comp6947_c0_seq1/g.2694 comp6947_c0_seq1/m.2694 type:complete len:287 (-) comp6947_c0_seq1:25-885(-)